MLQSAMLICLLLVLFKINPYFFALMTWLIFITCCMSAPRANQRLFMRENELATAVVPRFPSSFHSFGENLKGKPRVT